MVYLSSLIVCQVPAFIQHFQVCDILNILHGRLSFLFLPQAWFNGKGVSSQVWNSLLHSQLQRNFWRSPLQVSPLLARFIIFLMVLNSDCLKEFLVTSAANHNRCCICSFIQKIGTVTRAIYLSLPFGRKTSVFKLDQMISCIWRMYLLFTNEKLMFVLAGTEHTRVHGRFWGGCMMSMCLYTNNRLCLPWKKLPWTSFHLLDPTYSLSNFLRIDS